MVGGGGFEPPTSCVSSLRSLEVEHKPLLTPGLSDNDDAAQLVSLSRYAYAFADSVSSRKFVSIMPARPPPIAEA